MTTKCLYLFLLTHLILATVMKTIAVWLGAQFDQNVLSRRRTLTGLLSSPPIYCSPSQPKPWRCPPQTLLALLCACVEHLLLHLVSAFLMWVSAGCAHCAFQDISYGRNPPPSSLGSEPFLSYPQTGECSREYNASPGEGAQR